MGLQGGANYTGVKVFVQFNSDGTITVRTVANGRYYGWMARIRNWIFRWLCTGSPGIKACTTYANVAALTSTGVLLVNSSELHVKGVLEAT